MKRSSKKSWFQTVLPIVLLTFTMAFFLSLSEGWAAAKYPSKPVTIVVPRSTGGTQDVSARGVQPYLQKLLGVSVVVANIPGASGLIGANKVYDAPADGYNIFSGSTSDLVRFRMLANQTKFGGEFLKGFIPLAAWLNGDVGAICVNKASSYKVFEDLAAKAKKDGVNIGIAGGVGSSDHLTVLLLQKEFGGNWTVVPFNSGGEAAAALLGNHIDAMSVGIAGAADPAKFRLLATTGPKRAREVPDVPTFVEMGYKSLVLDYHQGGLVKTGTDPAIVKLLENAIFKAASDPGYKKWAEDTKVPIGEPYDAKTFADVLKTADDNAYKVLPILTKSMQDMQKGK
jgi:tripartite-type tricarboxylate transporter receptor subunit TctC